MRRKQTILNLLLVCSLLWLTAPRTGEALASGTQPQADNPEIDPVVVEPGYLFRSAFVINARAQEKVVFRNNQASPDTFEFELTPVASLAGWTIKLYDETGLLLPDADIDGKPESTSIPAGGTFTVVARATSAMGAVEGDYIRYTLKAISVANASGSPQSTLQFAVPSAFVYPLSENTNLMRLAYVSKDARREPEELLTNGGENIAVVATTAKSYIFAYENGVKNAGGKDEQNVEFSIFSSLGSINRSRVKPFNNAEDLPIIFDSKPALASYTDPNSKAVTFAIVFLRKAENDSLINTDDVYNVVIQLFNANGDKINPLVSLTGNTIPSSEPDFYDPRIVPSTDGRYIISWGDKFGDIWAASLDAQTGLISSLDKRNVTLYLRQNFSIPTGDAQAPLLATLSDARTFLSFSLNATQIKLLDMDSSLGILDAPLTITYTAATPRDALQFGPGGSILFTWTDTSTPVTYFALIDKNVSNQNGIVAIPLNSPNNLNVTNVSTMLDTSGRAMIIWADSVNSRYLYYALVQDNGAQVTPPMIFRDAGVANNYTTSPNGQGIAGLDGLYAQLLPMVSR